MADEAVKQMQIQEDVKFMKDIQENYAPTYKNEVKIDNTSTYYDVDATKCSWGVSASPEWSQPDLFGASQVQNNRIRGIMVFKVEIFGALNEDTVLTKAREDHIAVVEKLKLNDIECVFLANSESSSVEFIRL